MSACWVFRGSAMPREDLFDVGAKERVVRFLAERSGEVITLILLGIVTSPALMSLCNSNASEVTHAK